MLSSMRLHHINHHTHHYFYFVKTILDEQILKFNFKVGELLLLKMQVESAICQEDLKLLRFSQYNFQRLEYARQKNKIQ